MYISNEDRKYIENKYHNTSEPFNPHERWKYHGGEYDPSTGLDDEGLKAGIKKITEENKGQFHSLIKAKCFAFVCDNMRIDVNAKDWFVGFDGWGRLIWNETSGKWNEELFSGICKQGGEFIQNMRESNTVNIWPDYDHSIPAWDDILSLGFSGLKNRASKFRAQHEKNGTITAESAALFEGIEITYAAIIRIINRLIDYAEKHPSAKSSEQIACLKRLSCSAPETFYDALQTIYIYFMLSEYVDNFQTRSLGHGLDDTLLPFYRRDLESGRYSYEQLDGFLAGFFMQFSGIGNYWNHPFYLAGSDSKGNTRVNELSYRIMDVYLGLDIYNPKIQIKLSENTPLDFRNKVLCAVRQGKNLVFVCEKGMVTALMRYGMTREEALVADISGCYEMHARGDEVVLGGAYINAVKLVDLVINNGYDERSGKLIGVETGTIESLTTFDAFFEAYLTQMRYIIDGCLQTTREFEPYIAQVNPSLMFTATIKRSLEAGVDAYQNGMKYNNASIKPCGFASAVDCLYAIKTLVYDEKYTTLSEIGAACADNYVHYEELRKKAEAADKYGNNLSGPDAVAERIAREFCEYVSCQKTARGGVFKPQMHSALQFKAQGAKHGATPDGRLAGKEFSKNGSPSVGADKRGVTALIQTALKMHPDRFTQAFCLDLMVHPSAVEGEDGLVAMNALIDVYMKGGGTSIQFNVVSPDVLRAAQVDPEKYRNLQIRVCGWNVLWNNLSVAEQEAYIQRAENYV